MVEIINNTETFEKPKELTYKNIIYWSTSARALEGVKEGNAIITKARTFLKKKLVEYDSENKCFIVRHLEGYNNTDYRVKGEERHFTCDCQFYNKVSKNWEHPRCSHIQAVLFYLEQKRWRT